MNDEFELFFVSYPGQFPILKLCSIFISEVYDCISCGKFWYSYFLFCDLLLFWCLKSLLAGIDCLPFLPLFLLGLLKSFSSGLSFYSLV